MNGGARAHSHGTQALDQARTRLLIVGAAFALACTVVGARLGEIALRSQSPDLPLPSSPLAEGHFDQPRANIIDRNGVLLATSLATASLYADPQLILDPGEAADSLSAVLEGIDREELLRRLTRPGRFVWIQRNLTPRQKYAVNALGIPGLEFRTEYRRVYPAGDMLAHLVGYTDIDGTGLAGAELAFDQKLAAGETVQLSVDSRFQHVVHDELLASVAEFKALGAVGLVLDARTGELVAMSSLPDFDPHAPAAADPDARFNRATLGVYEMGSTFKLLTAAMALESGKASVTDQFDARAPIQIGRFKITDYHAQSRMMDMAEIIIHSSNIGAARMAQRVGRDGQRVFMEKLGLTRPAGLELAEVGAPLVPRPWGEAAMLTIAFGHGMAVSPVQLAQSVAALVNGGRFHPATLRKLDGANGADPVVISPQTSDSIRQMMRLVVTRGTGSLADTPGYRVGGKTGSAEKAAGHGYSKKKLLASFIGAFPIQDPRYVVLVMIDEPVGNASTHGYATGGWVAAPAVGRIVERIGPLAGIAPVPDDAPEIGAPLEARLPPAREWRPAFRGHAEQAAQLAREGTRLASW